MADAKKLMPFILRWEGGFVDDPVGRGDATNKGVTIGAFRQFFGQSATVDHLKNITDSSGSLSSSLATGRRGKQTISSTKPSRTLS